MASQNSTSSWSWKIDEVDLKNQIQNYYNLKITESYRGMSVLIMSVLLIFSIILGLFNVTSLSDVLYSLIIYIPILFFVYKGNRVAIILLMVLWTLEKIGTLYQAVQIGSSPIPSIIWWLIVAPYIYKALKVENERRKILKNQNILQDNIYCTKCGVKQEKDAKFCTNCGFNLIQ